VYWKTRWSNGAEWNRTGTICFENDWNKIDKKRIARPSHRTIRFFFIVAATQSAQI
jgi:hypothetical protein